MKMETRTTLMTSRMILLYVLGVLGQSALGMEEPPSSLSLHNQQLNPMLSAMGFEDPVQKKAYTYVSEYKRLPVYNFGIGKRWSDNNENKRERQYSFGLGKRTRQYGFGLGKRNENQEYNPLSMSLDYLPVDNLGVHAREETLDDFLEDKRSRQRYSFGLGKRAWNLANGESIVTGKRPNDFLSQRYSLGLGKRMAEEDEDAMQ